MEQAFYTENKDKTLAAYCLDDGQIIIKDLKCEKILFTLNLFNDNFDELRNEWLVILKFKFISSSKYLIISYGISYLYIVDIHEQMVVKKFHLFNEVVYDDNSFQDIDLCCYYAEHIRIDFSPDERYLAVRVRGNYDPQESDGRDVLFTPVYFRTIFIIDMLTLEMIFTYTYPGDTDKSYYDQNLAVIAFHPEEELIIAGTLGGMLKMFDFKQNKEICGFGKLEWISNSTRIDNRKLAAFIDNDTFVYVSEKKQIVCVRRGQDGTWNILNSLDVKDELIDGELIMDIEYKTEENKLILYINTYGYKDKIKEVNCNFY